MAAISLEFYFPTTDNSTPPSDKEFLYHIRLNDLGIGETPHEEQMFTYHQAGKLLKQGDYEDAASEFGHFLSEVKKIDHLYYMALASKAFAECMLDQFDNATISLQNIPSCKPPVMRTYCQLLENAGKDPGEIHEIFKRFL